MELDPDSFFPQTHPFPLFTIGSISRVFLPCRFYYPWNRFFWVVRKEPFSFFSLMGKLGGTNPYFILPMVFSLFLKRYELTITQVSYLPTKKRSCVKHPHTLTCGGYITRARPTHSHFCRYFLVHMKCYTWGLCRKHLISPLHLPPPHYFFFSSHWQPTYSIPFLCFFLSLLPTYPPIYLVLFFSLLFFISHQSFFFSFVPPI